MASQKRNSVNINNFFYLYMLELGMSKPAKQEFINRAKTATGLENFESLRIWDTIFTQPCPVLEKIVAVGPFEVAESIRSVSESENNLVAIGQMLAETGTKPLLPDLNELPASSTTEDEQPPADSHQIKQVGPIVEAEGSAAGKCRKPADQGGSSWVKSIKVFADRVFKKVRPANKLKHKAVLKFALSNSG